jgi:glycosyltransferase involved in cell wall biosynthesis
VIRVVHVITRTNIGGPAVIASSLLADGRHPDVQQSLVRGMPGADEGDYFEGSPLLARTTTVQGLGRSPKPLDDLRALVSLVRLLRRERPDVVHTHMAKAGVLGRIAAFVARVPVRVHTFHGHLLHGYFGALATRIVVAVERLMRLVTTHAVVVGSSVHRDLVRAGVVNARRSSVINPGVEPFAVVDRGAARRSLGLPADGDVVMYVGRLAQIKRPDRFLDLADDLAARSGATFALVGDGPLGDECRARIARTANAVALGWQRDLGTLLGAADVVVLCSDNEGVPLLLIEAALAGRPVVTTDVGAVRDVVRDGETGVLVPAGDRGALATAVDTLLSDPALRDRLGSTARDRALREMTASAAVDRHVELYRTLVERRSR